MGQAPCCGRGRRGADLEEKNQEPERKPAAAPESQASRIKGPQRNENPQTSRNQERRRDATLEERNQESEREPAPARESESQASRIQRPQRNEDPQTSRNQERRRDASSSNLPHGEDCYRDGAAAGFRRDRANNDPVVFSYRQLADATRDFGYETLVGEGGFGSVFVGILRTGEIVAVKRLNQSSRQGDLEFLAEVLVLSTVRHPNIINMIGYCAEGSNHRLIVYEFLRFGSLEYLLHDRPSGIPPLDWNQRMRIGVGIARALSFLHHGANPPVIYRDLKSSNILLGEGLFPKLSDFGLSRFGPLGSCSHVTTLVMGTHGYCAPEYLSSGELTTVADVYSFGVVLLELITGNRALDPYDETGVKLLAERTRIRLADGGMECIAEPALRGEVSDATIRRAVRLALKCAEEDPQQRPNMIQVVHDLQSLTSSGAEQWTDRDFESEEEGGDSGMDGDTEGEASNESNNINNKKKGKALLIEDEEEEDQTSSHACAGISPLGLLALPEGEGESSNAGTRKNEEQRRSHDQQEGEGESSDWESDMVSLQSEGSSVEDQQERGKDKDRGTDREEEGETSDEPNGIDSKRKGKELLIDEQQLCQGKGASKSTRGRR